jgi:hypothetical protein
LSITGCPGSGNFRLFAGLPRENLFNIAGKSSPSFGHPKRGTMRKPISVVS